MSLTLSQCPACLVSGSRQDAQTKRGVRAGVRVWAQSRPQCFLARRPWWKALLLFDDFMGQHSTETFLSAASGKYKP